MDKNVALGGPKNKASGVSGVQGTRAECHEMSAVSRQGPGARWPSGALSGVMKPARFPVTHSINFQVSSVHKENKVADPKTLPDSQGHGHSWRTPTPPAAAAKAPRPARGCSRYPTLTETASWTAVPLDGLGRVPLRPGTRLRLRDSISSRQVRTSSVQQGKYRLECGGQHWKFAESSCRCSHFTADVYIKSSCSTP